ncbi:MAG TPA: hypothetical protein VGW37_05870 [Terriglobia bacterium]|nr:hypothetical protein [Terriglobia bacterium]
MRTERLATFAACFVVVLVCTGCSVTNFDLTGTKGAKFKGQVSYSWTGTAPWDGKLPEDVWEGQGLGIGWVTVGFNRLQECEFLKVDTNTLLVLRLKTHGFKGSVTAPPGTAGVRVVRVGKRMVAETLLRAPQP